MLLHEFNRIVRQVLILPILALLITAVALFWQIHTTNGLVARVQESGAAIAQANLVGQLIFDEETGLRGYEIAGDPRFLEPTDEAASALEENLDRLAALSQLPPPRNADQTMRRAADRQLVDKLRADHRVWHDTFALPMMARVRHGDDVRDVALNLRGKALMDGIRQDLKAIVASNEHHRLARIALWQTQVRVLEEILLGAALLTGLLIGLFTLNRLHVVSHAYEGSLETLRSQAEEIFLSEQQLRTTLASIGDGVIACDPEGRVVMMNQVACDLTGWRIEDAREQPLEAVFHIVNESTRKLVENPVAKVKRLNRVVGLANHTLLIRKDGVELNIDDSGAPIRNPAGELTGIVMVFRDITLEKRTRDALVASEKLAVAGRLSATIAHEIHNPLDSVSNLLYLLSSGSSEEEAVQFLALARQELDRVTQISRSMLSLYRESKAPVRIDIKDMLEDTLLLLERRIQDLGVKLVTAIPKTPPIEGFPAELRQVFTNLITNAAEAASSDAEDERRVEIRIAPRITGKGEVAGVLIEIEDNGPGIPSTLQDKLFQPFVTTKGEGGTGLGLWVSRGIVRKHGGDIHLISPPEGRSNGTLAVITLAPQPVADGGGVE